MRPASEALRAAVRASHKIAVDVQVLRAGQPPVSIAHALTGGSVTVDANAASRGRMELTLVDDGTFGLVPTTPLHMLAPYGSEVQISRGVQYANRIRELVSLGIFRIDASPVTDTGSGLEIKLSGLDRSGRIIDARFEEPYQVAAGTNIETAILNTTLPVYPGLQWDFPGSTYTTPLLVAEEQGDRWAFCQQIAAACGLNLYFNGLGVLVLKPQLAGEPVATIAGGEHGVLLSVDRDWKRAGAYNVAIVTGENTGDQPPVRAVAIDNNPDSPTYAYGSFGRVPVFLVSQLVTTTAQAGDAALALLQRQLGTTQEVNIVTLPDPTLEPDDAILITRERMGLQAALHVIDQQTISLAADAAMSSSTRSIMVGGGQGSIVGVTTD